MPKVSVIIPTYNRANYISEAIDSVLAQTYKDFEIIIVDDGSIDNTKEVIQKYSDKISYYFQKNSGVSSARNLGIKLSAGEYLAFLDADDIWLPEYLSKMLQEIQKGYSWVVCDNYREKIDVFNNVSKKTVESRKMDNLNNETVLRELLSCDRIGSPIKILVETRAIKGNKINFDTNLNCREDWDFSLQLTENNNKLGWVREPLVIYRIRNNNTNSTRKMGNKWLDYTAILLNKHHHVFKRLNMQMVLSSHYYDLSRRYIMGNINVILGMNYFLKACSLDKGNNLKKTIINKLKRLGQTNR